MTRGEELTLPKEILGVELNVKMNLRISYEAGKTKLEYGTKSRDTLKGEARMRDPEKPTSEDPKGIYWMDPSSEIGYPVSKIRGYRTLHYCKAVRELYSQATLNLVGGISAGLLKMAFSRLEFHIPQKSLLSALNPKCQR